MDKIFIIGATGVIGKRVTTLLIARGYPVKALSRSTENDRIIRELGATPVRADLFDEKSITEATRGISLMLHLATAIPKVDMPKMKDWELNDKIRSTGTDHLLKAAQNNGVDKFIGQSICALYGDHAGELVTSQSELRAKNNRMMHSAYEMENLITREEQIDFIILRFGTFFSPDSYHTQKLLSDVKRRKMPLIGHGNYYKPNIHSDDAAESIIHVVENFRAHKNRIFNITDQDPLTYKEMLLQICDITRSPSPRKLPKWVAKLLVDKNIYEYLTASIKIGREPVLKEWNPAKTFRNTIGEIASRL
jgi:2-alkyl-3-oxoalkanoate reductase